MSPFLVYFWAHLNSYQDQSYSSCPGLLLTRSQIKVSLRRCLIVIFKKTFCLSSITWHQICSEVRVEGLETLDYLDNLMRRERFTEQADAITFDGEVM